MWPHLLRLEVVSAGFETSLCRFPELEFLSCTAPDRHLPLIKLALAASRAMFSNGANLPHQSQAHHMRKMHREVQSGATIIKRRSCTKPK
jgi:hypothetical protein